MKTKKAASMLPLLAGIGFGIIALASPFLLANHYVWAQGVRYSADNYLFFFWGKYYTVAGEKLIQSSTVLYDLGDFPVYAMGAVIIGMISGAVSLLGGRGLMFTIKGRTFKAKLDFNPILLQFSAFAFVLMSYLYMNNASKILVIALMKANYVVDYGPSFDFLLGSILMFSVSTIVTAVKFLKENKSKNENKDKDKIETSTMT